MRVRSVNQVGKAMQNPESKMGFSGEGGKFGKKQYLVLQHVSDITDYTFSCDELELKHYESLIFEEKKMEDIVLSK